MAPFRQRRVIRAVEEGSLDATVIQPRGEARAPGSGQPARLLVLSGPRAGALVALGSGDLTVGRGWDNDVVLPDISVSRRHALLRREGEEYVLRDQGSGNGTTVNGREVEKARLRDGDEISLGDSVVQFVAAGAMVIRGNAAAVRERRPAGVPGMSRAAACAGLAAFLLGATVVGLRQGQAEPGGAPDERVQAPAVEGASRGGQPLPIGDSNPAAGARLREAEAQAAVPAPVVPSTVVGGSRSEAHAARRPARGKGGGPAAVGARAAPQRLDSASREGTTGREEGRPAEAIAAQEQAGFADRALAAGRDKDEFAVRASEAYWNGYMAKDLDPDAARRAFRLVVALLPPGDETAVKAQRWLNRLEGRTQAEEEPPP